ncbi:hypothetical protein ACHQM5_020083 [Ranunculus cassubicifolius]
MPPTQSTKGRMGRRKIPMEKIQRLTSRQVTFSKRRSGLSKKASELCILCGAEVAIIVFSLAGKVYSFGHPYVDSVIDRFLDQHDGRVDDVVLMNLSARGQQLRVQYTEVLNQLEEEKKKREEMEQLKKTKKEDCWSAPIENLEADELEKMMTKLEELRTEVRKRLDEVSRSSYLPIYHVGAQYTRISTTPFGFYIRNS